MKQVRLIAFAALAGAVAACGVDPAEGDTRPTVQPSGLAVDAPGLEQRLSPDELKRGRMDRSWREFARINSVTEPDTTANREQWEQISAASLNGSPMTLPLRGDVSGPSVLRTQILLDRVVFSPGVMDGRWGKNTEKAVYWFQRAHDLPATGQVDQQTYERLQSVAGSGDPIRSHIVSAADVSGPFVQVPEDVYDKAKLDCMCYETQQEQLAELFHTTPELLRKLNPGVNLATVRPGTELMVPNVRSQEGLARLNNLAPTKGVLKESEAEQELPRMSSRGEVAKIVVSDGGHYVHGLDANGKILYHFPSTLGSDFAPSPSGDFKVDRIAFNPTWHYQPKLLTGEDDSKADAMVPPGPNNAVGIVWMDLSKPHYGIHGTSAPETIGYATSHGCVRLTNWDALFLARRTGPGVPVQFVNGNRRNTAAR